MIKALLSLDENLASSIALRYTSHLASLLKLEVQVVHVEQPDKKHHSAGSGWVRRTWERGLQEAGHQVVQRLLKTEKVNCNFAGIPKILVGDRDSDVLEELRYGNYDLFLEGDLNTSNVADFHELITSRLYAKADCPVIIVKNLIANPNVALLCGDGVDQNRLVAQFAKIFKTADLKLDLLYYKFQEAREITFQDKDAAGGFLGEAEAALVTAGCQVNDSRVVTGTPERVGDYLRNYSLVASTFPTRRSPRMEMLAHAPAPVLLCR